MCRNHRRSSTWSSEVGGLLQAEEARGRMRPAGTGRWSPDVDGRDALWYWEFSGIKILLQSPLAPSFDFAVASTKRSNSAVRQTADDDADQKGGAIVKR